MQAGVAAGPLADPLGSAPVGLLKGLRIQLGTVEVGVAQVGSVKATAPQVGAAQGGSPQVGVAEVAVAQVRPIKPGLAEVGALQLCSPQVGVVQLRMHEVGITEAALGAVPVLQHLHEGIGLRLHAGAEAQQQRKHQQALSRHGAWANLERPLGSIGSRDARRAEAWRQSGRDGPIAGLFRIRAAGCECVAGPLVRASLGVATDGMA